jgi:hypothetical protein
MGFAHMLLIDLDPRMCPENHSGQLKKSLRSITSVRALQTVTRFPPVTASAPPDLIILQPCSTEHLSAMVQHLKGRWNATPVLGLLCTGKDTPAAGPQALFDDLDDFFTCPIRVGMRLRSNVRGKR